MKATGPIFVTFVPVLGQQHVSLLVLTLCALHCFFLQVGGWSQLYPFRKCRWPSLGMTPLAFSLPGDTLFSCGGSTGPDRVGGLGPGNRLRLTFESCCFLNLTLSQPEQLERAARQS